MKVLIIGETCVDNFVYCEANRLSPEAPVPVLTPIKITTNPGMAGNTAANVKALAPEANVMHLTQGGSIIKTRYVEEKSNHMFLRVDDGENNIQPFNWTEDVDIVLNEADIVIVSDYNKGLLTDKDLINIGRKSKLSILDSKRKLTNNIAGKFTFIKLNESESKSNPHLTTNNVIVTLGAQGASYNGKLIPQKNPKETIDVSGAGDTFTAAFILNYFNYKNIEGAIAFANVTAGKVVSKRGVVVPS